ncbi:MAG: hypothetical protein L0332_26145 [Chloroflexi bacterium]|nr:hypothetical protein [Chloroflexota bacterium]MCI0579996.1 hypothetical protein [Chloroflexota bacterium]MCI0646421.1 hypothetical protein [Chloroflexota bacterium]MCI0730181.1 hypothetical protein [Chloroflexota bacterium]
MDDLQQLTTAIRRTWSHEPSPKAQRYVGKFLDRTRRRQKIMARVQGNHGVYTVSINAEGTSIVSACTCYIGKGGGCHHCAALAATFLADPGSFQVLEEKALADIRTLDDLPKYLNSVTLDGLIKQLKEKGFSQKAFAESIGMSSRHLSAVKSSELRNRTFHELGATKLACLWVLARFGPESRNQV